MVRLCYYGKAESFCEGPTVHTSQKIDKLYCNVTYTVLLTKNTVYFLLALYDDLLSTLRILSTIIRLLHTEKRIFYLETPDHLSRYFLFL